MKKTFVLLYTLAICSCCIAQEFDKPPSPASAAYHEARQYTTTPPYGLEKVQRLIKSKTVKRNEPDEDAGTDSLPEKLYQSLAVREKFTYNMIYGESYSQNCDGFWPVLDEDKKIFANLPPAFLNKDNYWSKRQKDFFKDNKDSVIALMTESINRVKRVGLDYKHVIVDINATSMIPLLIATYNLQKKDHDILTVLNLLMEKSQYPPFMSSATYAKLYANKESYYEGALVFNQANEELIIQRATDLYNGLAK
jgi:hypothetical protein